MPVKVEPTPPLQGLSPAGGKPIVARFDGGLLSSDGGLLALREVERRLGLAERLAACIDDPRLPERVRHGVAEILRFRMLMIAAGYEDGNDADSLRHDPIFKLALDRLPDDAALCSQPTISRLENLPGQRALLRMAQSMVEFYCGSFRQVPRRIVLDIDDTFDAVHGEQQLRLFNAHYDEYGFQPIVVFDDAGRPVAAMLRPAKRPSGREARAFLRRLVRTIRGHWPRVEILIRADSHYCAPEVLDFCRAEGLDFMLGVAPTTTLRRHVEALERSTAAQRSGTGKLRRYKEFLDGAASWSRVERIIARVEAGPDGIDTRFVVTNLSNGAARRLYERTYCKRGQADILPSWRVSSLIGVHGMASAAAAALA
jgi:Transposase DDE domain group 1